MVYWCQDTCRPYSKRGASAVYLIGGLLMIALGLFMLLRPDDFFDLAELEIRSSR